MSELTKIDYIANRLARGTMPGNARYIFNKDDWEEFKKEVAVTEDTSDGFHTFKELYRYRLLFNAALFNEWSAQGKYDIHKSHNHSDGQLAFGGGWFVVVATLPTGQITNHYESKDWHLFDVPFRHKAAEWDGHTPAEAAERLLKFLKRKAA